MFAFRWPCLRVYGAFARECRCHITPPSLLWSTTVYREVNYLQLAPIFKGHSHIHRPSSTRSGGGGWTPHISLWYQHTSTKNNVRTQTKRKSCYNSEHCIYGTALAYNSDSLIVRSHATFRESKALSIKLTFRFLFFLIQNWSELLDKISKPAESLQLPVTTQHAISHVVFVKYFLLPWPGPTRYFLGRLIRKKVPYQDRARRNDRAGKTRAGPAKNHKRPS